MALILNIQSSRMASTCIEEQLQEKRGAQQSETLMQVTKSDMSRDINTVELQWLEHLLNHENMFESGVASANEC